MLRTLHAQSDAEWGETVGLVVTGTGKSFCSGFDLKASGEEGEEVFGVGFGDRMCREMGVITYVVGIRGWE